MREKTCFTNIKYLKKTKYCACQAETIYCKIHCILRKHKRRQTHFSPISIQNIYPAVGDLIIQNKQRSKDSGLWKIAFQSHRIMRLLFLGNIFCVFVFSRKKLDLKPAFSNILKCLSVFDIIFLVSFVQ